MKKELLSELKTRVLLIKQYRREMTMTYDAESQFASSREVIRQSCGLEIPIVVPVTLGVVIVSWFVDAY